MPAPSLGIVALGAALVVGAALVFLWLNGALVPDRDVTLAVFVVVTALALILLTAIVGFGRFPIAGYASYVHDWWFPRFGPGWRLHQGTDEEQGATGFFRRIPFR